MQERFSLLLVVGAVPVPAQAASRQILGYAGLLGELELTATVNEETHWWRKKFSGLLSMKNTSVSARRMDRRRGTERFCLQISAISSQLDATLLVEGIECSYSAKLVCPL